MVGRGIEKIDPAPQVVEICEHPRTYKLKRFTYRREAVLEAGGASQTGNEA